MDKIKEDRLILIIARRLLIDVNPAGAHSLPYSSQELQSQTDCGAWPLEL